jgi:hypothetical protein
VTSIDASHHGAVYDRGYRPYEGERGLRGAATYALFKASIRRALGIRRSWRQKVAPFVLLGVVTIPAIVNVGIGWVTRNEVFDRFEIITYRDYVGVSSALLLFVAIVAPDVMCPDRRQHVLPLMFARPMTGNDYVAAKVGAIGAIVFFFSFIPQVILFIGNMLVSDAALDYLTGHLDILWKVPVSVRPTDRRRSFHHRPVPDHLDRLRRHRRRRLAVRGGHPGSSPQPDRLAALSPRPRVPR